MFSWIFKDFLVFLHPKRIQNNPITKQNMVKITRINTNRSGKSAVTASSLVKLIERMTRDDCKNSVGAFRDFVVMAQNHYGRGVGGA